MKITIIGTGYVGLVSGVLFADLGNDVICVDNDNKKINLLKKGIVPIYEPGLEEILKKNIKSKRIKFTSNISEAIKLSKIIFIAVGTPTARDGISADLKNVYKVAKDISKNINNYKIIVNKSTVPIGTGDEVEKIILRKNKKKKFDIISNPEFLREGEAIRDFKYPDRIVIGSNNLKKTKPILEKLYLPIINKGAKFLTVSRRSSELIKYASNAFLATKITFINEIANLCESTNTNVEDIAIGIGTDQRIGSRFLRAGPAFGGSCFPKDTRAIVKTANKFSVDLSIIKTVIKSNENRKKLITNKIIKILGSVKRKRIGFLGVTFKANTDDMRDSQFLKIYPKLLKKGASLSYYEPTGKKYEIKSSKIKFVSTIKQILENNDMIVIHTEWDEFRSINFSNFNIKKGTKIFDLRNLYKIKNISNKKIRYYSIGRPNYE
ncbi:MAG: UDP-glucose 6-dehydrogenase [Candidatus Pelagibacter sp.]|nr:UDP-glucose 6-dehydrogenase [Candidatus Pelagibacter sp.]OUW11781.1 MAG: UDP-glucose 6-dehydrogenase [Candidatus Pelagibacter sp. TMED166]|tara:strand:+ start:4067 stop:5374 length:1308 start_codon:yes stop_codon:yes gene_type:complete